MHKQRIAFIILAIAGIISVLLPWVSAPMFGSVNGTEFNTGILMIVMYSISIILAILQDRKSGLSVISFYACLILPFAAGAIALSNIIKINSDMSAHHAHMNIYEIGIGLYSIVILGVLTPLLGYFLRGRVLTAGSTPEPELNDEM